MVGHLLSMHPALGSVPSAGGTTIPAALSFSSIQSRAGKKAKKQGTPCSQDLASADLIDLLPQPPVLGLEAYAIKSTEGPVTMKG